MVEMEDMVEMVELIEMGWSNICFIKLVIWLILRLYTKFQLYTISGRGEIYLTLILNPLIYKSQSTYSRTQTWLPWVPWTLLTFVGSNHMTPTLS